MVVFLPSRGMWVSLTILANVGPESFEGVYNRPIEKVRAKEQYAPGLTGGTHPHHALVPSNPKLEEALLSLKGAKASPETSAYNLWFSRVAFPFGKENETRCGVKFTMILCPMQPLQP